MFVRSGKLTYNEDFWQDEVADYPVREHGRLETTCLRFSHRRPRPLADDAACWAPFTRVFLCCRGAGRSWRRGSARSRSTYSPACTQRSSRHVATSLTTLGSGLRTEGSVSTAALECLDLRKRCECCRQSLVLTDFCCLSRRLLSAVDGRAVAACRFQFKTNYWDVSEAEEQARILRQTAEQWEAMQAEVGAEGQETEAAGTPK